jgi:hypothetical protein
MKRLIQIAIAFAITLPSVGLAECYTLVNTTNHQVDVKYVPQGLTPGAGFVASQSFSPGSQQQYCTPYKVNANIATPNTIWEGNHGLVMGPGGSPQGTYRMVKAR